MKRSRVTIIAVIGFLVAWLTIDILRSAEPSYNGRSLSSWITDYLESQWNHNRFPDGEAAEESAIHAVRAIGTNAIPTLLQWLQIKTSPTITTLNKSLNKQRLISFRFETATRKNILAINGFQILGSNAAPAIPALVTLSKSPERKIRLMSVTSLEYIDDHRQNIVPALLQLLQNSDKDVQVNVAQYLHDNYPSQAEQAGVYKLFPQFKSADSQSVTNSSNTK